MRYRTKFTCRHFWSNLLLGCFLFCSHLLPAQQYETLIKVKKDGKWGYLDESGQERIPCQFSRLGNFCEGLALAKKDSSFYYYNTLGEVILDLGARYDECGDFSDGVAVAIGKNSLDEKYGSDVHFKRGFDIRFIDHAGKEMLRLNKELRIYDDFPRGLRFQDGMLALEGYPGTARGRTYVGYADKKGALWSPFIFQNHKSWVKWQHYQEGLAGASLYPFSQTRTKDNPEIGGMGYINKKGRWVIPPRYHDISPFHCGAALVTVENWKPKANYPSSFDYFYIDKKGQRIFADSVQSRWDLQKDSIVAVFTNSNKEKYALAKTDGTLLTDFEFDYIHKGEFWAVGKAGKFGFINDRGEIVIPLQYHKTFGFAGGIAFVMPNKDEKVVINQKNEVILGPTTSKLYYENHEGIISRHLPYGEDRSKEYFNSKGEPLDLDGYEIAGYGNQSKFQRVKRLTVEE
ncbi:MAG: WG repeat-containing protein [Bacteroidota bacterium]